MSVLEVTPQVRDIPLYIESIGTLHPSAHVDIHSVIDGKIEGIYIAEGTEVSKGEKLIEIDPRAFDVKVKEAEAQLNIDLVHLQSAEKKRERYRHLAQKDLVAQVEWNEIESEVAKAMAVVELDRARLKATELDLEQCTLTAPIAGKVGKFTRVKGDMIHASQSTPLMTIDQIDPLKVEFFLSGHEVCKLLPLQLAKKVITDPYELEMIAIGESGLELREIGEISTESSDAKEFHFYEGGKTSEVLILSILKISDGNAKAISENVHEVLASLKKEIPLSIKLNP